MTHYLVSGSLRSQNWQNSIFWYQRGICNGQFLLLEPHQFVIFCRYTYVFLGIFRYNCGMR